MKCIGAALIVSWDSDWASSKRLNAYECERAETA